MCKPVHFCLDTSILHLAYRMGQLVELLYLAKKERRFTTLGRNEIDLAVS